MTSSVGPTTHSRTSYAADVIPLLLKALATHPHDEHLVEKVFGTLGNLCISHNGSFYVRKEDLPALASDAVENFPRSVLVQHMVWFALTSYVADDATCQERVREAHLLTRWRDALTSLLALAEEAQAPEEASPPQDQSEAIIQLPMCIATLCAFADVLTTCGEVAEGIVRELWDVDAAQLITRAVRCIALTDSSALARALSGLCGLFKHGSRVITSDGIAATTDALDAVLTRPSIVSQSYVVSAAARVAYMAFFYAKPELLQAIYSDLPPQKLQHIARTLLTALPTGLGLSTPGSREWHVRICSLALSSLHAFECVRPVLQEGVGELQRAIDEGEGIIALPAGHALRELLALVQ